MKSPGRRAAVLVLAGGAALLFSIMAGGVSLNWGEVLRGIFGKSSTPDASLFLSLRLPRVVMAGMVGALLAGAGSALQAILRNPLADPYLLGVSSGAALGAVAGVTLGIAFPAPLAVGGALLSLSLVLALSRRGRGIHMTFLILAGAAVHSVSSAALTLLLFRASGRPESSGLYFWLLGGLTTLPWKTLGVLGLLSGAALGGLFFLTPALNIMVLGSDSARALGLPVERLLWILLILAAAATGLAVTFNGMIPFVGLLVPAMARTLAGGDHRRLFPLSVYLGAVLTMTADALGRCLAAPQEIPTGVVTALVGAPFFLLLLRREGRRT